MEYNKKQRIYKTVMLLILVIIITFICTSILIYHTIGKNDSTKYVMLPTSDKGVNTEMTKVKALIDKYYLGDVDEQNLSDEALMGYVKGLGDEYSEYIPKKDMESFETQATGNYDGIGIYYGKRSSDNKIVVVSPIKDSPAAKAGIMPGDVITKVDDYDVTDDSSLTDLSNRIKGKVGTSVKLTIQREDQTLEFEVNRENIKLHQIATQVLDNKIGYMEIYSFDEDTAEEFAQKYQELSQQGIQGLILDLRNNPGGIVQAATGIADDILDKDQTILITKDKNGKEEITRSENDPIVKVPVVVLVNENSASASEILAGALKDHQKAKLIGEKTYGKGVIQNVFTLSSGAGLKITTNEYFTPNNQKINKIGIEPDIQVSLPDDVKDALTIPQDKDTQLKCALQELQQ